MSEQIAVRWISNECLHTVFTQTVVREPQRDQAEGGLLPKTKLNSVALVRKWTIPTERPPHVGEVSANFCG
jgi:hypothetical protein